MITVEKLEKGTYFDDAFKISFRYDPTTVAKVKELAERRYLPEDRAWEIPAHELPALIEKVGLSNIKSEEAVVQALNTKEIEDKREATQERLKGIKPVRDFDFKTAPLPHQIEAFNYGMEKNSLLIGDEQGLGKTKESIDICVARKKELIKTLIVCGVNSVKYNWEKEIQIHSNEGCVMVDGKTMDVRVQQLNDWYRGSSYFGVINIESLRNEKIQDALYLGIKDGYIGAIIVDEIHKAKNGGSQQGKALRFLKAPVKIGLSGTPMNKAEDLWNILTWLGVERRSFYSFRNAYCTMGGFGGYKVIGYKNLDSLNAELNTVMLRRKKEEVLDLPPKGNGGYGSGLPSTTKGALIYNSYTALRPSKKILSDEDPTSKKTLSDTSKNFLLNKDSKDNIEKSISKEMEGKAPKKRSYSTILEDPVNKFVKEALSKFIQYCRGKNYTPKVTTVEKFASTLRDNAGEDPVVALAIVDQSIDKGWKDLYPLKNYGRQGKPTAVSKKFSGNTLKDAEGKDIVFK